MAGLPLNNPRLQVATVGFVAWEECQVGVLITPWAINLAVVAADAEDLRLGTDCRRTWHFPSGDYDLMGGNESECGAFQFCSLFSPAHEFADQAAAEATATEIMQCLMAAAPHKEAQATSLPPGLDVTSALQSPVSRRGFLRGDFGSSGDSNPV